MNSTTNAIAGSVTRHTLTGVGVAGMLESKNEIVQILSLLVTIIGLVLSIWEKKQRPPAPVAATPPSPNPNP